jgi:hypothetical protein
VHLDAGALQCRAEAFGVVGVHRARRGPRDDGKVREDAVEVHVVGADDPVRQRVQTEIGVGVDAGAASRSIETVTISTRRATRVGSRILGPCRRGGRRVGVVAGAGVTSGNQVSRIVPFSLVVARPMPHTVRCSLMPSRLSKPDPR